MEQFCIEDPRMGPVTIITVTWISFWDHTKLKCNPQDNYFCQEKQNKWGEEENVKPKWVNQEGQETQVMNNKKKKQTNKKTTRMNLNTQ